MAEQLGLIAAPQEAFTSNDFYTPPQVFPALGLTFDLDVCAPPGGVPWIPATRYLTRNDDGLSLPWVGRIWMNPPFSKPAPWVERFLTHRHGVALLPFSKSAWFRALWASDVALIHLDANNFLRHDGSSDRIPTAVCLAAFGPECVAAIGRLGRIR